MLRDELAAKLRVEVDSWFIKFIKLIKVNAIEITKNIAVLYGNVGENNGKISRHRKKAQINNDEDDSYKII